MAAALVALFLGGIFVTICVIISVIGIGAYVAPYAGGALASVMVCETIPGAKGLVPGHTFLNYLVILAIVETIIILLMHVPSVSRAVNVLATSFFLCVVGFPIMDHADALTAAFKEYSAAVMKKKDRPSVLKVLKKMKELVASIPDKVRNKDKEHTL